MEIRMLPHAEAVMAFLDDEATAAQRARAEGLLASDPNYRELAGDLQMLSSRLQALPRRRLSAGFVACVYRQIRRRRRQDRLHKDAQDLAALSRLPLATQPSAGWEPLMCKLLAGVSLAATAALVMLLFLPLSSHRQSASLETQLAQNPGRAPSTPDPGRDGWISTDPALVPGPAGSAAPREVQEAGQFVESRDKTRQQNGSRDKPNREAQSGKMEKAAQADSKGAKDGRDLAKEGLRSEEFVLIRFELPAPAVRSQLLLHLLSQQQIAWADEWDLDQSDPPKFAASADVIPSQQAANRKLKSNERATEAIYLEAIDPDQFSQLMAEFETHPEIFQRLRLDRLNEKLADRLAASPSNQTVLGYGGAGSLVRSSNQVGLAANAGQGDSLADESIPEKKTRQAVARMLRLHSVEPDLPIEEGGQQAAPDKQHLQALSEREAAEDLSQKRDREAAESGQEIILILRRQNAKP